VNDDAGPGNVSAVSILNLFSTSQNALSGSQDTPSWKSVACIPPELAAPRIWITFGWLGVKFIIQ
jgi:uncharacterized membrane protein YhdT